MATLAILYLIGSTAAWGFGLGGLREAATLTFVVAQLLGIALAIVALA